MEDKLKGLRKAGIATVTITGLIAKSPTDFRVTVVIGIVAVVAIMVQGWLDRKKS